MSEKDRALTAALSQIERSYGKGAIMKLGEAAAQRNIDVIPTGSLTLDMALGVGGIPRGRVVEIYGPESSGKTTLALHVIAQSQKLGGVAAFIDAEHALDPVYAGHIGVKTEDLLISQPDSGAQADRRHLQVEHLGDLHQPAAGEGRHHVRQPRGDDRRPGAEVLRLDPT